jgi:cellulose synthase/poly-beta-1,6-N-acetylglucosamine synthase-like glycosyltransferase
MGVHRGAVRPDEQRRQEMVAALSSSCEQLFSCNGLTLKIAPILMKSIFWFAAAILFYTYIGYGILLYGLVRIRRAGTETQAPDSPAGAPEVTFVLAAYNEEAYVDAKVRNLANLDYPADKIRQIWLSDGSDDGTVERLSAYEDEQFQIHPNQERRGKVACLNQGMTLVTTPITILSDVNAMLSPDSLQVLVAKLDDRKVGCVAGEKRIVSHAGDAAAGTEGLYWRYESALKRLDAELYSVVGADGGLFALRTNLFQPVEDDTLLDDFVISLRIAMRGYTIQYDPRAFASETASATVGEELKRRIRISAGGIQSVIRLRSLLNPFRHGLLTFQYLSHRVLRWTLAPLSLPVLLGASALLAARDGWFNALSLYSWLFWLQILFYLAALAGWYLEDRQIRVKILFVPYYFAMMNLAVYWGFMRYLRGSQSVSWEKAERGL